MPLRRGREGRDDWMVLVAVNESTGPTTAAILVTHPVDDGAFSL